MSPQNLVTIFSSHTKLPVQIQDVVDQIVEMGVQDRITYVGVELDLGVLRGQFIRLQTERPGVYADPICSAEIYYATNQDMEWQRIVVCKELIHLFDTNEAATKTQEDLDHLMDRMAISPELQFQKNDGFKVEADKIATLYAIAILFPKDARDALIEPYKQGLITAGDISRTAEIPEKYIRLAMLDGWDDIYGFLIADS
jgi:hypothetical protein